MNLIDISCPSCGFSRQMPADRIPAGVRSVTCPKCKTAFSFSKPEPATAAQQPESTAPARMQPPPQPPQPAAVAEPHPEPPPAAEKPATTPVRPPRPQRVRPAPRRMLPDISTLFSESWAIYQRRFAVLIGLYLLTVIAFIIPPVILAGAAILAGAGKGGAAFVLAGALGVIVGIYFGLRCLGGFLYAVVDEQLAFSAALEKGKTVILPLLWVGFLTGFIISGGFLLCIIPGLIFMVWFFFAQFIVIKEDVRGMGALLKSKEYVRGEWFNVALRLLLVWAASMVIGMIPLAGPVLSIAFLPFVMIFHYLIYRDLRELKGDVPYSCATSDLLKWPALALVGYVLVPALIVTLIGGAVMDKLRQLPAAGITVTSAPATSTDSTANSQGLRVINFPDKEAAKSLPLATDSGRPNPQPAVREESPENIHIFIYAANYTGTVRANDTTIKEMEGKPDVQYSYNLGGTGLRYGENRIDLDYSELPAHQRSLLEVHIRVSRNTPGKEREVLGEWRMNEKGTGTKSYTFDIPK